MISGVTIRNLSFSRVENTNSVKATFQVMIEENGSWRDVTYIGDLWFKYYSSNVENPRNGLGSDWQVQDVRHYTSADIGNVRTGTPTSQGGEGYWYTYTWSNTPDENHAKVLKSQCTAGCANAPDSEFYWPQATAVSGNIPSPAAEDAEAAKHAAPPTPTSPTATLSDGKTYITAGCTVPSGSAVKAEIWRQVDTGGWSLIAGNQPLASSTSVSYVDSSLSAGHKYKYKYRLLNIDNVASAFSSETSYIELRPADLVDNRVTASCTSIDSQTNKGSVKLEWALQGVTGTKVKVEWSDLADFSGNVSSAELDYPATVYTATNLDAAKTWYFRVSAYNSNGSTSYAYASCLLASVPTVTVMPLLSAYKSSESVTVQWVHASADGSAQDQYQVRVTVGGTASTSSGTTDTSKTISLSGYSDGTVVDVEVRTHSVGGWSAWSTPVQRFTVYAPPSVTFSMTDGAGEDVGPSDPLTTLPLRVTTDSATYSTGNEPIWWHLTIAAGESYTTLDPDGTETYVSEGEVLLDWSISAGDTGFSASGLDVKVGSTVLRFEQAKTYVVKVECSTAAGLRAESPTVSFTAALTASVPVPNAVLTWDENAMAVKVKPSCTYYDDTQQETVYVDGVTLAVYRVSQDGEAYLVDSGIANDPVGACIDPHADLGTSTYRIVATHTATGIQAATDRSVETPFAMSVVLWDEGQTFFDEYGEPMPYRGHALMGTYNNVASESYAKDTAYREHAGAAHPIARRGTQRGHKLSMGFDMEAGSGEDALLRNLEAYDGDCYVRVPGFPGFPADARVTNMGKSYDNSCRVSATVEFTHVMDGTKPTEKKSSGVEVVT